MKKSQLLDEGSSAVHQVYSNSPENEVISSCPNGPTQQNNSLHEKLCSSILSCGVNSGKLQFRGMSMFSMPQQALAKGQSAKRCCVVSSTVVLQNAQL